MKKGNLIFIVGGLGLLYYYYTRNKKPTMLLPATKPTNIIKPMEPIESKTNIAKSIYPEGLYELDVVANGVESAQLFQGQLRPFTAEYAQRYLPNSWSTTKIIPEIVYRSIPRGAVLDI
jgi:hypothetical protein